jgi:hypothetical protein
MSRLTFLLLNIARVMTLALKPAASDVLSQAHASVSGQRSVAASLARGTGRALIAFGEPVELLAGQTLDVALA